MSGFKIYQGTYLTDLDNIFVLGTSSISDTGYKVNGVDLKDRYQNSP